MSIITIARGSYSRGKEVSEILAERLGYSCVSRDILLEASKEFNIPEIQLIKALHDAPSVLERFSQGKERYISFFCSSFFNRVANGNTVYHGLAGHFFLQDISHVLKVRIIANTEDRIREEMKREGCSKDVARYSLKRDDEERRRWGIQLYGRDTWDSRLYDMVLKIDTLSVEDVVDILEITIKKEKFTATAESEKKLKKRTVHANINAKIVNISPRASVKLEDDIVYLSNVEGLLKSDKKKRQEISDSIIETYGVKDVIFTMPAAAKDNYVNPFYNPG
ncbi:MAG: cytidylate kinase-like family protein [Desulfobulbaceae bacterium]|nr:cytidylate kinase-like family protein [Desulfobulbaceae bacterium]